MTWLGRVLHNGCERTTTVGQAAAGLGAGVLTGTVLTTIGSAFLMGPFAIVAAFYAVFVWGIGLFVIATPGWWLLSRLGVRCQSAAVVYGGGLTFLTISAWGWIPSLIYGADVNEMTKILPFAGLMSLAGMVVGWVVAKVAYGRGAA